jgi:hypothetical protein
MPEQRHLLFERARAIDQPIKPAQLNDDGSVTRLGIWAMPIQKLLVDVGLILRVNQFVDDRFVAFFEGSF